MISDKTRNMAIKTISLFIFGLFAVIAYAYFHELSHYIAAKILSLPSPTIHYGSMTTGSISDSEQKYITSSNIRGNESVATAAILVGIPGILFTVILSVICSILLMRKKNCYIFLTSLISLETSFIAITSVLSGITSGNVETDLAKTIVLTSYLMHLYQYEIVIEIIIVILTYIEFLITFYPVIIYLKSSGFAVGNFLEYPKVIFYPVIIIYVAVTRMIRASITNMELFDKYYAHYCIIFFISASVYFWINIYGLYLGPMILP